MNKRKGLSTKISSNDQSLIKYIYYNYDPIQIDTLRFTLDVGATYLKGAKAGQICLKTVDESNLMDGSEINNHALDGLKLSNLKFFDTGTVDSISSNLEKLEGPKGEYYTVKKTIPKKPVLELFQMRLCEHLPDEATIKRLVEEQKKVDQTKTKTTRKMQRTEPINCTKCKQRLFYFYFPKEKVITLGDVLKQIQLEDEEEQVQNIEWAVMLGQTFTKTTQLAKLNESQFFLQESGKISYLASWTNINPSKKSTQVMRYKPIYCQHQKIQSNTCQYCFEEVDPYELNLKKFLFQMEQKDDFKREMITTGSTLTEQQNKFVDDLLQKQRGILILDLDNTVLHSIQLGQIHKSRLDDMEEFYELMLGSSLQYNSELGTHYVTSCFVVKMRPYFKQFIQTAIKYYEIYVYTKGTRMYAEEICNAIRNQYASRDQFSINKNTRLKYFNFLSDKNAFTPSRIITRDEDPDLQKKSLNNILPTRQQNLMVMDDLSSVWSYSSAVLFTIPYHFFFKQRHISLQKQKQINRAQKLNGKALDQSKEGEQLQPVEDLHTNNIEPVRELPCDHFDRQVVQFQNNLNEPVVELPCDHFEKEVSEIEKKNKQQLSDSSKEKTPEQINSGPEIMIKESQPGVFQIKKGLAPEDKQYDYDIIPRSDYYLLYAANNLVQIHKRFFSQRKTLKSGDKRISFGLMHRKLKSELLEGTVIKLCMKNQMKIDVYGRAMKLGCKVLPMESQSAPQYLIRLNNIKSNIDRMYFKKEEQNERKLTIKQSEQIQNLTIKQLKFYSQTLKIPIVSESWIDFCYSFTFKFPIQPFIIDSDSIFNEVHEQDYQWVIEENANQILQNLTKQNQD